MVSISSRRVWLFATALAISTTLILSAVPAMADRGSGKGGNRARGNKVEGTVTAVNPLTGQVAIRTRNGAVVVVVAVATTKVERNDVRVPLSAILVGDRGQALFDANFIASKIESVGP